MGQKGLSPDAQFIMEKLYAMLNYMECHEKLRIRKLLDREALEHFIKLLEKELGIISLR